MNLKCRILKKDTVFALLIGWEIPEEYGIVKTKFKVLDYNEEKKKDNKKIRHKYRIEMVVDQGFEPWALRLRVACSTS